jgi:GNAT superfamily N-acetyltransferase
MDNKILIIISENDKDSLSKGSSDGLSSRYGFDYKKRFSQKGNPFYEAYIDGDRVGMVEFHKIPNNYVEIDRIYLSKEWQKRGIGPKIISDVLENADADGFELYPLDFSVWLKMGVGFIEDRYPEMVISKRDFMEKNFKKLA